MINIEALFSISYGLYVVCSGDSQKGNGYISNTCFQVTADPLRIATCCNKDNYTASFIQKKGNFSISVLHEATIPEVFGHFGYRSGKDFNKLDGFEFEYGALDTPIFIQDVLATIECKVIQTVDLGTHLMFIGDVVGAQVLQDQPDPMTYLFYKKVKKGVAPKNAPTYVDPEKLKAQQQTQSLPKYKCAACGYIYDDAVEEVPFEDLPDDWICPTCGSEKEDFYKI
jgi:flavin reductase (DIM6/NTAB) family NADH-FMN oxidoreductase RutF/rubredoxin